MTIKARAVVCREMGKPVAVETLLGEIERVTR